MKERKERYTGRFGGRKEKEECCNYNLKNEMKEKDHFANCPTLHKASNLAMEMISQKQKHTLELLI